jgi:hypothetical protein
VKLATIRRVRRDSRQRELQQTRPGSHDLKPACDGPNANIRGSGLPQSPGARAGRRTGRKNVIDNHDTGSVQIGAASDGECAVHIRGPFPSAEQRLCPGELDSFEPAPVHLNPGFRAKAGGQALSLVEFAFTFLQRMEGNGHDRSQFPARIPAVAARHSSPARKGSNQRARWYL